MRYAPSLSASSRREYGIRLSASITRISVTESIGIAVLCYPRYIPTVPSWQRVTGGKSRPRGPSTSTKLANGVTFFSFVHALEQSVRVRVTRRCMCNMRACKREYARPPVLPAASTLWGVDTGAEPRRDAMRWVQKKAQRINSAKQERNVLNWRRTL